MRDRFSEYYTPSNDEFTKLWEKCLFVPDANILLHLFRYGRKTTDEVLGTLEGLKQRVWIPYQVGLEFQRNWRGVDQTSRDAYDKLSKAFQTQGQKLSGLFDDYARHPTIVAKEEKEEVEKFVKQFLDRIQASKDAHPTFEDATAVFERLSDIIGDAVGQAPTHQQRADLVKEGKKRHEASIPPGFRDASKGGIDAFGDYFIWQEVLEKAKVDKKPVVIITDDVKDDWWRALQGKKIGPRPELIAEMKAFAGQQFYLYTLSEFLIHAKSFLKTEIDPAAIQEIKQDEVQLREAAAVSKEYEIPIARLRKSLLKEIADLKIEAQAIDAKMYRAKRDELQLQDLLRQKHMLFAEHEKKSHVLMLLGRMEDGATMGTSGSSQWF